MFIINNINLALSNIWQSCSEFYPEVTLVAIFLLLILQELFATDKVRFINMANTTKLGLVVTSIILFYQYQSFGSNQIELFLGMLVINKITVLYKLIITLLALAITFLFQKDLLIKNAPKGSAALYIIFIATILGLNLMVMSKNLLMIYLSVEMVSVCSYVMVAYLTQDRLAEESGMKYMLFGAVASALMIYGISWIYGLTGTLNLSDAAFYSSLATANTYSIYLFLLFILGGLLFKIAAFPFHFWTPDVYQGSSIGVMAFLSVLPKIAAFALLYNVVLFVNNAPAGVSSVFLKPTEYVFSIIAIITMSLGNLSALGQSNLKRMMAYSSIAQSGFVLMGIATYNVTELNVILYYLVAYSVANIGIFYVLLFFQNNINSVELNDYRGLGKLFYIPAISVVIFFISLTGLPPTAGFVAKLFLFSTTAELYIIAENKIFLVLLIVAVINTVISLFYYIKLPWFLFFKNNEINSEFKVQKNDKTLQFLMILCVVFIFGLFILPKL